MDVRRTDLKRLLIPTETAFVMTIKLLGRGACEYLPQLKLLISFWPVGEFTDDEWDGYVAEVHRYSHTVPDLRVLTWNTQNANPRPEQQQRMSSVEGGSKHRVAIVTREQPSGFATAVLAFVNPNIRAFSEEQWDEAWTHLGLTPAEQFKVERALQNLRQSVE